MVGRDVLGGQSGRIVDSAPTGGRHFVDNLTPGYILVCGVLLECDQPNALALTVICRQPRVKLVDAGYLDLLLIKAVSHGSCGSVDSHGP